MILHALLLLQSLLPHTSLADCEHAYVCVNHHVACNCPATPPCKNGGPFPVPVTAKIHIMMEFLEYQVLYHGHFIYPNQLPHGACGTFSPVALSKKQYKSTDIFAPDGLNGLFPTYGSPMGESEAAVPEDIDGGYNPEAHEAAKTAKDAIKGGKRKTSRTSQFEAASQNASESESLQPTPDVSPPALTKAPAGDEAPAATGAANVGFSNPTGALLPLLPTSNLEMNSKQPVK